MRLFTNLDGLVKWRVPRQVDLTEKLYLVIGPYFLSCTENNWGAHAIAGKLSTITNDQTEHYIHNPTFSYKADFLRTIKPPVAAYDTTEI